VLYFLYFPDHSESFLFGFCRELNLVLNYRAGKTLFRKVCLENAPGIASPIEFKSAFKRSQSKFIYRPLPGKRGCFLAFVVFVHIAATKNFFPIFPMTTLPLPLASWRGGWGVR
jgi:hypothetical protein